MYYLPIWHNLKGLVISKTHKKMKNSKVENDHKGSPIIMQPDKEKEVSKKDKESEERISNSSPEQFAELKETNLRMKDQELELEEEDDEEGDVSQ